MKHKILMALAFLLPSIASAQTANYWYPASNYLRPIINTYGVAIPSITGTQCLHVTGTGQISGTGSDCSGSGTNFFSNLLANTFLNTGINLQAPNLQATSTSGINYFVSNTAVGTTTSHFPLDVASSTGNTLGGSAQLVLTDTNAGANLKHWGFTSESGHLYLGQITDLNATTTNPALSFNPNNGNVGINSPNPIAGLEVGGTFRISAPSEAGVGTRGINFTAGTAGNNSALNNINNGVFLIETTPTTSGVISAQEVINPFSGFNFNTSVSPAGVSNRMNILSTGQVQINTILQIGTTSSPWLLDVAGNSSQAAFDNGQFVLTDTNAGANLKHFQETYESGTFYMGQVTDLLASTSPYLTILNGGKIGISTSSPSQMLSVQGNGLFSGNVSLANLVATGTISLNGNAGTLGQVLTSQGASLPAIWSSGGFATSTGSYRNQAGSVTSVNTYTPIASSTYEISVSASIRTISAGTLTITCTYTNSDGVASTATFFPMGLTTAGLSGTGSPALSPLVITPLINSPVTIVATFTGVSINYDVDGTIKAVGTATL